MVSDEKLTDIVVFKMPKLELTHPILSRGDLLRFGWVLSPLLRGWGV